MPRPPPLATRAPRGHDGRVAFTTAFETRHSDTYADTGFVHAGVLLALTEMAYARFEAHCGVAKPDHVVAVQRETRAVYHAPLGWREGATVEVNTTRADERSFEQEFAVRSTARGTPVATFVHVWAWLDTVSGRGVPLPPDVQVLLLRGAPPP